MLQAMSVGVSSVGPTSRPALIADGASMPDMATYQDLPEELEEIAQLQASPQHPTGSKGAIMQSASSSSPRSSEVQPDSPTATARSARMHSPEDNPRELQDIAARRAQAEMEATLCLSEISSVRTAFAKVAAGRPLSEASVQEVAELQQRLQQVQAHAFACLSQHSGMKPSLERLERQLGETPQAQPDAAVAHELELLEARRRLADVLDLLEQTQVERNIAETTAKALSRKLREAKACGARQHAALVPASPSGPSPSDALGMRAQGNPDPRNFRMPELPEAPRMQDSSGAFLSSLEGPPGSRYMVSAEASMPAAFASNRESPLVSLMPTLQQQPVLAKRTPKSRLATPAGQRGCEQQREGAAGGEVQAAKLQQLSASNDLPTPPSLLKLVPQPTQHLQPSQAVASSRMISTTPIPRAQQPGTLQKSLPGPVAVTSPRGGAPASSSSSPYPPPSSKLTTLSSLSGDAGKKKILENSSHLHEELAAGTQKADSLSVPGGGGLDLHTLHRVVGAMESSDYLRRTMRNEVQMLRKELQAEQGGGESGDDNNGLEASRALPSFAGPGGGCCVPWARRCAGDPSDSDGGMVSRLCSEKPPSPRSSEPVGPMVAIKAMATAFTVCGSACSSGDGSKPLQAIPAVDEYDGVAQPVASRRPGYRKRAGMVNV
eukprot:TRINITY_DN24053_c0_g1_i1.p1 TRINITY_DN24053_c0_g1~~TRINITY_DN24053_c0_g1_i1.p1  ORF type:complete len:663 (-),score=136.53 TRINITY_DN24053_c0_g1_i1:235-2223(-)